VSVPPAPQPGSGNGPRVGSLCTGYGGLDLAVELVLGGRLAWYAETDPHARTVLATQWPDVANLDDIRAVDWSTVEPVDTLTAGFPCQDYPEGSVIPTPDHQLPLPGTQFVVIRDN
jgi:hypothetical protein